MDVDFGMGIEEAGQDLGVDALGQHAHGQRLHALDHFVGRVGVEERAFDVVHVPEHRFVPLPAGGGFAFGDEHVFVASDDDAGNRGTRARQILGVAVNDKVGTLVGIVALQRLDKEWRADR